MNATEARKTAEQLVSSENQKSIKEIEKSIEEEVKKGGFYCTYYNNVNEIVKSYFERQGFKVKYQDEGRNEFSYRLDW